MKTIVSYVIYLCHFKSIEQKLRIIHIRLDLFWYLIQWGLVVSSPWRTFGVNQLRHMVNSVYFCLLPSPIYPKRGGIITITLLHWRLLEQGATLFGLRSYSPFSPSTSCPIPPTPSVTCASITMALQYVFYLTCCLLLIDFLLNC